MSEKYLSKWEPFKDLLSLRSDFDRLFDSFFGKYPERARDFWAPLVDIEEGENDITVKAEIPGLKKEDIKVAVRDNVLTVSGERKHEKETKEKTYHRIERAYGKFQRSITLPTEVDPEKVKATYHDGVLNITLPKPESTKPKQIDISVE